MKKPQEVFESHMNAVSTLNPACVLEDYAEDALFITPDKTYKGSTAIYDFYDEFLPNFEGFDFITIKQETHANIIYFVWRGMNQHLDVVLAMDTYIVKDGKIKQHTFAATTN